MTRDCEPGVAIVEPVLFQDSVNVEHGFIRSPAGVFTTFDAPGAGTAAFQGTLATCIGPDGTTAGFYVYDSSGASYGFVRSHRGTITSFDPPGAGITYTPAYPSTGTYLNPAGAVTGYYFFPKSPVAHGFLRDRQGGITRFDVSGAVYTQPISVNARGTVTGNFKHTKHGAFNGFVRQHHGRLTTFIGPLSNGSDTIATAINDRGAISGYQYDANFVAHGFVRQPKGDFIAIDAPDAGTCCFNGTYPEVVNAAGSVVGRYTDDIGVTHSFVWNP